MRKYSGRKYSGFRCSISVCTFWAMVLLAGYASFSQAVAQSTFGSSVVGTVRDTSGAAVPAATLTIKRLDGNSIHATVSDNAGAYVALDLVAGNYEITAAKYGFASTTTKISLDARRQLHTDLVLERAASAGKSNPSADSAADADGKSPLSSELSKGLEAMKARIAELEALMAKPAAQDPPKAEQAPAGPLLATTGTNASSLPALPGAPGKSSDERPLIAGAGIPATSRPLPAPAAAAQTPDTTATPAAPPVDLVTPFADYDWTWLNGNPRNKDVAFDSKFFTPEIRADITYTYDFNKPVDNSMGGSSELFRSNEIQLEQLGIGGDFHWDNVRARFMTQFGEYSMATIRNDATPAKGQWNLNDADRYLAEAYGGYHINWMKGMNIDAGIFMSYVGLFSYYNFDNWAYQPSYVSSNTPWFFEGIRIQIFPTHHLKIEPWIINGWQSYASANSRKGLGGQIKWTPFPWMNVISNNYGLGHDDLYTPNRARIHTDNSIEIKYYDKPKPGAGIDKIAFTFTGDLGCEFGGGVSCYTDKSGGPKQSFIGYMLYNKFWWHKDLFSITVGGGQINNPGRYLVLIPPINGETASSAAINSPYFTFNPGDPFKAWDTSVTFDYMPRQWLTFRFEGDYRHASVPYWSGAGGVTPPPGTNNGQPTQYACMDGAASGSTTLTPGLCSADGGVWYPDLRKDEVLFDIDLLVKF